VNHPVFELFRPFLASYFEQAVPPVDEEYFEWVDLLLAVWEASQRNTGGHFVMAEVGAGHGRWGIRGAQAAFFAGLNSHVVFVEAEPQHCKWLCAAVAKEFVGQHKEAEVLERVIAHDSKQVPFYIQREGNDASNWFGQYRLADASGGVPTDRIYHGFVVFRLGGDEYIEVPAISVEKALERVQTVDLLDMDLQGAEMDVARMEMELLTAKVRKVHIGTHSQEIEEFVRARFTEAGWRNVWDFECGGTRQTPYGRSYFQDGVQTWVNPKPL
jgi:FkbM family methyltransferase